MTSEELRQRYRLLKAVAEDDVRTYHALDVSGQIVMVHHLPARAPDAARLLGQLDGLSAADKRWVVERLDVDGAPVVVTQLLPDFRTLAIWLQERARHLGGSLPPPAAPARDGGMTQVFGPAAPPTPVAPPPAAERPRTAGDFTRMFGPAARPEAPAPPAGQPAVPAAPPPPASPPQPTGDSEATLITSPNPPPAPPGAGRGRAGEFTQLFGPGGGVPSGPPTAATPPNTPPATPPSQPPAAQPPGPSVRWREPSPTADAPPPSNRPVVRWKKDVAPAPPPSEPPRVPPAPRESPKSPGEFTRLFGPSGEGDAATPPPSSPPAPHADPWAEGRSFGPAASPPPAPPGFGVPPAAPAPGEFTRMFQPERKFGPAPSGPPGAPSRDYFEALSSPTPSGPPTPVPPLSPPGLRPPTPGPGATKEPGEFTRLLSGLPAGPGPAPGRDLAPPGRVGVPAGPSDFTRIVGGAAPPPTPASLAPPSAGETEETPGRGFPRLLVLLVALGAVFLIAVVLVLHFALKGTP